MKGYTESLEHRLVDAENALYRILRVSDETVLYQAFQENSASPLALRESRPSDSGDVSQPVETNKAEVIAHWESFPLTTPHDLVRWLADVESRSQRKADQRESHPQPPLKGLQAARVESVSSIEAEDPRQTPQRRRSSARYPSSYSTDSIHRAGALAPALSDSNARATGSDRNRGTLGSMASTCNAEDKQPGGLDLPLDFRRQFVW